MVSPVSARQPFYPIGIGLDIARLSLRALVDVGVVVTGFPTVSPPDRKPVVASREMG
jgi:hypothetical protein